MRRIVALGMLIIFLLAGSCFAEGYSAREVVEKLAGIVSDIGNIQNGESMDGAMERAIWTDVISGENCSLLVYADELEALAAAIENANAYNLVRNVGTLNLYLGKDPDMERVEKYDAALREIMGVGKAQAADYILNVNTRKFHRPDCGSVENMNEKNKMAYSGDKKLVIDKGYEACKRCKP